ncbi:hypothetical protein AB0M11_08295 [Streptomyces sp. NPDC051987]|uniref:hypothetical protein n=1 Tax=Streptomyces sp. NPDC051987 TaxID=3155808 RepID=UPI00341C2EEA
MSARDVIEHALRVYYADGRDPNSTVAKLLAQYDAERDAEQGKSSRQADATPTPVDPDQIYRDAYATGREHAGAAGWLLQHFTPVFTTSDGTDVPAKELRCGTCNAVTRNTRPRTLLDHVVAAAQHECLPNPDAIRKDGRS